MSHPVLSFQGSQHFHSDSNPCCSIELITFMNYVLFLNKLCQSLNFSRLEQVFYLWNVSTLSSDFSLPYFLATYITSLKTFKKDFWKGVYIVILD